MTNHFLIGAADKTERLLALAGDHYMLIDDGPIADAFLERHHARLFDIHSHHFNPLKGIDYKRARDIAAALYTASPEGKDTLTVRNGRRALARLLDAKPERFDAMPTGDGITGAEEALATIDDMLLSPILREVLCNRTNFRFTGKVVVKLNRAEIGEVDAFLLACLLIGQSQGQVIVPDGGFYLRDFHVSFIRQNRLIAGVTTLSELSPRLRQMSLTIKDIQGHGCVFEDAETLANYAGLTRDTNGFGDFVRRAMDHSL